MDAGVARRLTAEAVGTGLLVAAVVGSGIAAERRSPGDTGLELLENSFATAAALVAVIRRSGPCRAPTSTRWSPWPSGSPTARPHEWPPRTRSPRWPERVWGRSWPTSCSPCLR